MDTCATNFSASFAARGPEIRLKMYEQWLQFEHYRLHTAQRWPESPYKQATLAAIYSTIESLLHGQGLIDDVHHLPGK